MTIRLSKCIPSLISFVLVTPKKVNFLPNVLTHVVAKIYELHFPFSILLLEALEALQVLEHTVPTQFTQLCLSSGESPPTDSRQRERHTVELRPNRTLLIIQRDRTPYKKVELYIQVCSVFEL